MARNPRGDDLDHLVEAAPDAILVWLRRKAELADGTRPGLPVGSPRSVRRLIARHRSESAEWTVRANRKTSPGWDVLEAGLLRDMTAAIYAQIGHGAVRRDRRKGGSRDPGRDRRLPPLLIAAAPYTLTRRDRRAARRKDGSEGMTREKIAETFDRWVVRRRVPPLVVGTLKRAHQAVGIWSLLALVAFAPRGVSRSEGEAEGRRPNLVLVVTDDQRHDMLGGSGVFPFLETPALTRLAREGAVFENAFVTTSLCSPSRASILTGAYAFRHGVVTNEYNDPHQDIPTFPALLQRAGYETALIGKWHMRPSAEPRPGFDHWISFRSQGRYDDQTFNVNGTNVQGSGYITDTLTDHALDFLRRDRDGPFALVLTHKAVHRPPTPAARHAGSYAEVPLPVFHREGDDLSAKPSWLPVDRTKKGGEPPAGIHDPALRRITEMMRAVDEGLGRILTELEERGLLDQTVVVFTSDNGLMLGEHGGLHDKRNAYEPSIRVPLIVRYPPLIPAGIRIEAMALNVDFAPTFLELAGVPIPESVQGESLVGLVTKDRPPRRSFLYEYYREYDHRPRGGLSGPPTTLAVRTPRWKYVSFPGLPDEIEELYDLAEDPHELVNLAGVAERRDQLDLMRAELKRLQEALEYEPPPKVARNAKWLERRRKLDEEEGEEDD